MSEKIIPTDEEVVEAAGNVVRMLGETSDSPINPEYIRDNFETALEDENIRLTILTLLKLLVDRHEELLINKEILGDALIFITYLEYIATQIPEEVKQEVEEIAIKLIPVIEALNLAGSRRVSENILLAIQGLSTNPSYRFAYMLYSQLQMAIELKVVTEESAKANLEEVFELIKLVVIPPEEE